MEMVFPLYSMIKQQCHSDSQCLCVWQWCLSVCDALSLCVHCGIRDKWRVWETAWEAKSSRHAQLPICLWASPPAADPFEFNLRETVEQALRRWERQLHFRWKKKQKKTQHNVMVGIFRKSLTENIFEQKVTMSSEMLHSPNTLIC